MPKATAYDYLFKVLLIGDVGVGKSSFLKRFSRGPLNDNYLSTIGVDFEIKTIQIDDKIIKLQIWDTAGQERFRTITSSYYRGAHAVILMFDITNRDSFDNLRIWLHEIENFAPESAIKLFVGNKCDLKTDRTVTAGDIAELSEDLNIPILETSAKDGTNVDAAFHKLSRSMVQNVASRGPPSHNQHIVISERHKSKSAGCCWGGWGSPDPPNPRVPRQRPQANYRREEKEEKMDVVERKEQNQEEVLSDSQRRFREFVFKNSNFRGAAHDYYGNMVRNGCDDLMALLDFEEDLLVNDFKMTRIHSKQFMRKVVRFREEHQRFEQWMNDAVEMSEYRDGLYQRGIMTFEIFYAQCKGIQDVIAIIGQENEFDARILWNQSPKIQRKNANRNGMNREDVVPYAQEGPGKTAFIK